MTSTVPRDTFAGNIPGSYADEARINAYTKSLWEGYDKGSALSSEQKNQYQQDILGFIANRQEWMPASGDIYASLVYGIARASTLKGAPDRPTQPHDPDVKALLRLAVLWNVPCAMNPATADFLFSSPWVNTEYPRV